MTNARVGLICLCTVAVLLASVGPVTAQVVVTNSATGCEECGQGLWRAQLVQTVAPGRYAGVHNPPCDRNLPIWTRTIGRVLYGVMTGGAPDSAGIVETYLKARQDVIDRAIRAAGVAGTVGEWIGFAEGLEQSSCEYLAILLPKGAKVEHVRLGYDTNGSNGTECNFAVDGDCLPWTGHTNFVQDEPLVAVVAKNWSHNQTLTANFRVYFSMR